LRRLGIGSSMLVRTKLSADESIKTFSAPMKFFARVIRAARRWRIRRGLGRYRLTRPAGAELFNTGESEHTTAVMAQVPRCDLIHLHWTAGFIDLEHFLGAIPAHRKLVWTLHDMSAFTGGCGYADDERFVAGCGACPQLGSNDESDLSRRTWKRKRSMLEKLSPERLHFVAPSQWLAEQARKSPLLKRFAISTIPYGLDLDEFAPRDRSAARNILGLSPRAVVALFVADWMDIRRKGFQLLAEALNGCKATENLALISIGRGFLPANVVARHYHLGFVADPRLRSVLYSAADVLVVPSLIDNLPNTILESMACGTPAVAFDVGGIPELVRDGVTGVLAKETTAAPLRAAIVELLNNPSLRLRMAANCRRVAIEEYALEIQALRYAALYETMLNQTNLTPESLYAVA
jgi:glycosyltransferase involved in cell wall biosynthesis